jgi:hypothetical protein
MSAGLQARIYDPLWLLARQWQIGEFQGEDNGSPAMAQLQAESAALTRFHAGPIAANTVIKAPAYDGGQVPLEAHVERERVRPGDDSLTKPEKLRLAVDAGLHFLRMLDQQPISKSYRDPFTRKYPLTLTPDAARTLDDDSLSFLRLMAGRAPDGRQIYAALAPAANGVITLPADLQIAAGDVFEVTTALSLWRGWYETLFSEPGTDDASWIPERMEYGFSVGTRLSNGEVSLTAQEYYAGSLEWHDFDLNQNISLGAVNDNAITPITQTVIPAPVTFRGAPALRFWEFEDAQVDFGSINAGPEDLARMLLVEFAVSYGNDWFVIPIQLPVGSVLQTTSLVVTNTFGERFVIPSTTEAGKRYATWRMYQPAFLSRPDQERAVSDLFFMPPTLVKSLDSRPIEEVMFLRDEMANMVWGVERVIESATESPLSRLEHQASPPPPVPPSNGDHLNYLLATDVPDYWVPLLPVQSNEGLRLRRAKLLKLDGPPQLVSARGRILNPDDGGQEGLSVFEEEVPREGIRVTRGYQMARWQDGSTHLWIGRRKRVGRGEGSSGLRFDTVKP